jgi:hypothetical protein
LIEWTCCERGASFVATDTAAGVESFAETWATIMKDAPFLGEKGKAICKRYGGSDAGLFHSMSR